MDTNLTGAFLCSQAAYPHMVKAGGGKIINIGSMMSIFAVVLCGALRGEQRRHRADGARLAVAWAKDNIQVNAILPGWIDTELTRTAREQVPGLHEQRAGAHAGAALGQAGRFRRHRGVSGRPASDFVTGAAIPVDGGYSVQACGLTPRSACARSSGACRDRR